MEVVERELLLENSAHLSVPRGCAAVILQPASLYIHVDSPRREPDAQVVNRLSGRIVISRSTKMLYRRGRSAASMAARWDFEKVGDLPPHLQECWYRTPPGTCGTHDASGEDFVEVPPEGAMRVPEPPSLPWSLLQKPGVYRLRLCVPFLRSLPSAEIGSAASQAAGNLAPVGEATGDTIRSNSVELIVGDCFLRASEAQKGHAREREAAFHAAIKSWIAPGSFTLRGKRPLTPQSFQEGMSRLRSRPPRKDRGP